ncbi:hypothetical protein VLW43_06790 [Escherichia coli]|nr:hypothetical protein [Escherichia coli]WRS09093.1 hypothetical protein VLW43_06790 [Escherichia coli]
MGNTSDGNDCQRTW